MVLLLLMLTRRVSEVQKEDEKENTTSWRVLHKATAGSVADVTLFLQLPFWDSDWDKKSQMRFGGTKALFHTSLIFATIP